MGIYGNIKINKKQKKMITIKRYTSTWCEPCKALAPIMMELQSEMNNVNFVTIDVDQNREAATQDNISSIPAVLFIKDGQEVYRFVGVKPKSAIIGLIKQFS
jgi:thioredoxin 1